VRLDHDSVMSFYGVRQPWHAGHFESAFHDNNVEITLSSAWLDLDLFLFENLYLIRKGGN